MGCCHILAYFSAVCIYFMGLCHATTVAAILFSAPEALSIALAFNPSWGTSLRLHQKEDKNAKNTADFSQRPYRLEGLVVRCLQHAPSIVLAVFADTVLREAMAAGMAGTVVEFGDGRLYNLTSWLLGVLGLLWSSSLHVRVLPLIPFVYMFFICRPPSPPPRLVTEASGTLSFPSKATQPVTDGVIIAGAGIGGLVLGACLQQLGIPFEVRWRSGG